MKALLNEIMCQLAFIFTIKCGNRIFEGVLLDFE